MSGRITDLPPAIPKAATGNRAGARRPKGDAVHGVGERKSSGGEGQ